MSIPRLIPRPPISFPAALMSHSQVSTFGYYSEHWGAGNEAVIYCNLLSIVTYALVQWTEYSVKYTEDVHVVVLLWFTIVCDIHMHVGMIDWEYYQS